MSEGADDTTLRTDALMSDIRRQLRERLRASTPRAEAVLAVEDLYGRAREAREAGQLELPEVLSHDLEWRVDEPLDVKSHRPWVGPLIVGFKRILLMPIHRWLYTYTRERFSRQQRLNDEVLSLLETLTVQVAELRDEVRSLRSEIEELRSAPSRAGACPPPREPDTP